MEHMKNFDEIEQSIKRMGDKWKEQSQKSDSVKTYRGVHKKLNSLYTFLHNERKDINNRISAEEETYSKKVVNEKRYKLLKEFDELSNSMTEAAKKEIEDLTNAKLERIAEMLSSAPNESQIQLLTVLRMRDDLEKVELQNIVPYFFDNYNALKVLQNIAKSNGIHVYLPSQFDVRNMYTTVERAHSFLIGACSQIATPINKMPIEYHAFYTTNTKEPGKIFDPTYEMYIDTLDSVPQLQEVKTEKTELSPIETETIKAYFSKVADIDTSNPIEDIKVLKHTKEVMESHPEDVELLRLSKYGKYVKEIEEASEQKEIV